MFVEADATRLPFAGDQFDLVASRFAIHHIDDVPAATCEMARVCRAGGTVALIDMVREEGAAGERHDELERLRDPSHRSALTERELLSATAAAGLTAEVVSERRQRMPLVPWLDQALPAASAREEVERAVGAETDGGAVTGLNGSRDEQGRLSIEHRWLIVLGGRR